MTSKAYRENYGLIDWSRPIARPVRVRGARGPRSDLPCPQIVRPFSEPVQSLADGKYYTDPGSLRKSYRADGNPHGVDFIELGNEEVKPAPEPKSDIRAIKEDIRQGVADYEAGWRPTVVNLED